MRRAVGFIGCPFDGMIGHLVMMVPCSCYLPPSPKAISACASAFGGAFSWYVKLLSEEIMANLPQLDKDVCHTCGTASSVSDEVSVFLQSSISTHMNCFHPN